MDRTADNIKNVVAILTAVISEQEELAYDLVLESDPIDLFGTMSGILLSALCSIAESNNKKVEDYLRQLGMFAYNN